MKTHKELVVWQKSMEMVKYLYQVTQSFPKEEMYGITSQIRRAAVSIPSNIAEGFGRGYEKELIHFLYIALGSASEMETQLLICRDIAYLSDAQYERLDSMNSEIMKMLTALINKRKSFVF